MNILKKIAKIGLFVFLGIAVLNVLLYLLLLIPAVQQSVLQFALDWIRPVIKTEVRIDRIQLRLFNQVRLEGVYLEDKAGDTLLYAKELSANLDTWKLFQNKVVVKGISLNDFALNISKRNPDSDYNYQFLIDAFASKDTAKKEPSKMTVLIGDIDIRRGRFRMDTKSEPETPNEFNVSHITLSNLEARLSLPSIASEELDIRVLKLSFADKSGLRLKRSNFTLQSKGSLFTVKNASLHLPNSTIDLPLAEFDILSHKINFHVKPTSIQPKDLAPFLPNLKQLKELVRVSGNIKGKLPFIAVDEFDLSYGNGLELKADGEISDYSRYKTATVKLSVRSFRTTQNAIRDIVRISDPTFSLPQNLKSLGDIRLKGTAEGTLAQLNLFSDVWTKQGAVALKAIFRSDTTFQHIGAKGKLMTQNFNLRPFATPSVGRISAQANFDYSQNGAAKIALKAEGEINSIQYEKANYRNIRFSADYTPSKISGWVNANMTQGKLQANFEMIQGKSPSYMVDGRIKDLHLNSFYKYEKWENPFLSVVLKANMSGDLEQGFIGAIQLEGMQFVDGDIHFSPGLIRLEAGKTASESDFMELTSSFLNARVDGKLNLGTITDEVQNIAHRYLPQFILPVKSSMPGKNDFKFTAQTKDTKQIEQIFGSPVSLTQAITASGSMNTLSKFVNIQVKAPLLKYEKAEIKESFLNFSNEDEEMNLEAHARYFNQDNRMEFDLNANAESDTIRSQINFSNETPDLTVGGQLDSYTFFTRNGKNELMTHLNLEPSMVYVNDLRFLLNPATVVNEENRTLISNLGMRLEGKNYLNINGVLSNSDSDTLHVNFTNAKLGSLLTAFSINDIDATLNGAVNIASATRSPQIFTDQFLMENIILKGDSIGSLNVASKWRDDLNAMDLDAHILRNRAHLAEAKGLVYLGDTLKVDMYLKTENMPIDWVQSFASNYLNKVHGQLSSNLTVKGSLPTPNVDGWIGIKDGLFGLDYTNVVYMISDTIRISSDKIGFNNLKITDTQGNQAFVDATFQHDRFGKYEYRLDMRLRNLMLLNTESRTDSLFYGKVFASGTAVVEGNNSKLDIKLDVGNAGRSVVNVLLPQAADAVQYQGIVYINTPPDTLVLEKKVVPSKKEDVLAMILSSKLKISDNLSLYVLLDPTSGNSMQVEGNGDVDFSYDSKTGEMRAYGNYVVTKGKVKINLQQLSNMEFDVQEGGTLTFRGDPLRTSFNIIAYKDVRADLATLDQSFATDNNISSTRIPVRCVLGIKGDMDQMTLTYNVELPESSDDVQQKVKALLVTDEQKIQQFVYLLFAGSFYGNSDNNLAQDLAVNGMMSSFASGALSKTLNTMFGRVLGDKWNIDTDILSKNGTMTNLDVNVNVSTRILDDRLRIRTNFGYRSSSETTGSDNLVGNVDLEYLLNRAFKLKVYSKENDKYYRQATTTQGIGIVYTKEAKKFKDFWNFLRRKKKAPKEKTTSSTSPK